jgi:fermentation-respiration switch protein FrsA (DUF1100 family)
MVHIARTKKIMAVIIKILVSLGILFLLLVLYLKHFEKTGIFYPTHDLITSPKDAGLAYEEVNIASGNETINGWFIGAQEAAPVILFCHGNGGNISYRVVLLKLFHDAGFNVFIFDYRGYGKSSGVPSELGFYEDALASYQYLTTARAFPPERIILYGESIGSTVAFDLAAKVTVAAVVSQGGFSSAFDMGKVIFPWVPSLLLKHLADVTFDTAAHAHNVSVPKLFIHGSQDTIVPFTLGKKLYEAAASPKEFFVLPGNHNEGPYVYQQEFINRFQEFIAKYLPQLKSSPA